MNEGLNKNDNIKIYKEEIIVDKKESAKKVVDYYNSLFHGEKISISIDDVMRIDSEIKNEIKEFSKEEKENSKKDGYPSSTTNRRGIIKSQGESFEDVLVKWEKSDLFLKKIKNGYVMEGKIAGNDIYLKAIFNNDGKLVFSYWNTDNEQRDISNGFKMSCWSISGEINGKELALSDAREIFKKYNTIPCIRDKYIKWFFEKQLENKKNIEDDVERKNQLQLQEKYKAEMNNLL